MVTLQKKSASSYSYRFFWAGIITGVKKLLGLQATMKAIGQREHTGIP
jgi:hypothetical protein